jgi:hypothetical protein
VCWLVPADQVPADPELMTAPLDIEADIARYGADTRGGVGV